MVEGGEQAPARILPPVSPSTLTDGVLRRDSPGTGVLCPQPVLTLDGRTGRLDELVGPVWIVAASTDPRDVLSESQLVRLRSLGAALLHVAPDVLVGDRLGVLIRPDHYLFAGADSAAELVEAVDDLLAQLPVAFARTTH
jgi:hypothetical protein